MDDDHELTVGYAEARPSLGTARVLVRKRWPIGFVHFWGPEEEYEEPTHIQQLEPPDCDDDPPI